MKFAGQSLSQLIAEQAHGKKVPLPQSGTLSAKCLHSEHSRCYKLSCGCKCHIQ